MYFFPEEKTAYTIAYSSHAQAHSKIFNKFTKIIYAFKSHFATVNYCYTNKSFEGNG